MAENTTTPTRPAPLDPAALLALHDRPLRIAGIERAERQPPVSVVPLAAAGVLFAAGLTLTLAWRLARPRRHLN